MPLPLSAVQVRWEAEDGRAADVSDGIADGAMRMAGISMIT